MKKTKQLLLSLIRNKYVKYIIVLAVGIVFVGFLDENSIWSHLRNKKTISNLKEEITFYENEYQRDQNRIRELQTNPKAMEKIARERYFMKTSDEDIFVLSDDQQPDNQRRPTNATVE